MRLIFALAAAVLSLGTARASDITVLGTFGSWQAFGGLAEDGKRVCGLSESGNDGRSFQIKYFDGNESLVIQVFKFVWSIPKGTAIAATVQFGKFSPWQVPARGYGNFMEFYVPMTQLPQFTLEFRAADKFNLTFLTGNEGAWTGLLTGSGAAMDRMYRCLNDMRGNGTATTQPFNAAPSQPFNPEPTAPHQSPKSPALPAGQGQSL
jgi:hypothetical protein